MRIHLLLGLALLSAATTLAQTQTNRFDAEIRAYESSDRTNAPPKNAVLFIGSSSIRLWKSLTQDFPNHRVINRGFGGSQIADSIHFAAKIVVPYQPRLIVFYAGGNDINAGKSAESVSTDFKTFVQTVHQKLPETRIAYISIAPNPARWAQVDRVREANRLIGQYTTTDHRLSFIDVFPHMLGSDGQPRPEIFVEDRLHMNAKGYAIWTEIVGEHLRRVLPTAKK
jgi:lysophospholipase L1-like esterase